MSKNIKILACGNKKSSLAQQIIKHMYEHKMNQDDKLPTVTIPNEKPTIPTNKIIDKI